LGFKVVAEGVEDEATLSMLRDLGCDRAQGWHIGKPMPFAKLLDELPGSAPGAEETAIGFVQRSVSGGRS
jgi:diguanylate cyclase